MGFLDDIIAQQSGGGMLGGLPATWQYTNPESLTPAAKQMMALVGTQNPEQAGFTPLPAQTGAFPENGTAPIMGSPPNNGAPSLAPAPAAPVFGAGASPAIFANPAGSTPGNPMLPPPAAATPPVMASDDEEEDTPAAKASPIAIGNYQMPRIGNAEDFAPNPAALPVNAQPAQGQGLPTPTTATPSPLGALSDHLKASWQSMRHGGGLIGGLAGLVTGERDDPAYESQRQQGQVANMTARALISRGVDPTVAIAAVQPGNAEMLKALIDDNIKTQAPMNLGNGYVLPKGATKAIRAFEPDEKFQHVTVKQPDGSESLMTFDPSTGKYTASPSPASLRVAVDPDTTGPARMEALMKTNPDYARKIKAMVNGDVPMPSAGQAARSPQAQRMIEDVLAVDGSTSAADFATRAATRKDYASGIASRVTKSLNTTIEHAARLDAAVDKLKNYTYFPKLTNWVHDKYSGNLDPEYQKAESEFESAKEAFVKELDFTLSGGHSSVSGSAELRDKINRADSPEKLHAAIQTDLHLLSARLDSHTTGYNQGTRSQRDGQDFLYPKNRAVFNRLMGTQDTSTGGEVPGVDNAPATSAAGHNAPVAAPVIPTLKVGETATIGNVSIKKVSDKGK